MQAHTKKAEYLHKAANIFYDRIDLEATSEILKVINVRDVETFIYFDIDFEKLVQVLENFQVELSQ